MPSDRQGFLSRLIWGRDQGQTEGQGERRTSEHGDAGPARESGPPPSSPDGFTHEPTAGLAADDTRDATPEELDPAYRDTGTVDAETLSEIREQLAARRKIEAIKTYREAAGCDLKSAKEAVERIAREHGGKKAA